MQNNKIDQKGFSLLEVLVALALTGVIVASAFQVSVQSVRSMNRQEDRIRLVLAARSVVAWWQRIPDSQKIKFFKQDFQPIISETGLNDRNSFSWRLVWTEKNQERFPDFIKVRNRDGQTITIPMFSRRRP